jgi:uncharacterized protein YqjF (DUF2071 family)
MAVSVNGVPSSGQNRTSEPKGLPQVGQAGTREVSGAGIALPLRFHYFTVPSGGREQESTVNADLATNCRVKRRSLATCAWVQTWREVFFAHWAVPEEAVRLHINPRIEIDTWRGQAWISAVAFRLNTRPSGWPSVPFVSNFLELNLRTYVRDGDEPAIWFLSMHGGRRLAVWLGQRLTPLPYRFAPMREHRTGERRGFVCGDSDRPIFEADYRPIGEPRLAEKSTLDAWLLERYSAIVPDRAGRLQRMRVEHPPWRIQPAAAQVSAGNLGRPFQLSLHRAADRVQYSEGVTARVGSFELAE